MKTIYLDHNVVDRIDECQTFNIRDVITHERTPVISLASLGEIERGGLASRLFANVQSLIDIKARLLVERPSQSNKYHLVEISRELILTLIASKDAIAEKAVKLLGEVHFMLATTTTKKQLELRIHDIRKKINTIRTELGHKDRKNIDANLLGMEGHLNRLLEGNIPDEFSYYKTLRCHLNVIPRELNNQKLDELWEMIENSAMRGNSLVSSDLMQGNLGIRVRTALLTLDAIGYWSEPMKKAERQTAFDYDCSHGYYGCLCDEIISHDKRFLMKLRAVYYYLHIKTKILHISENAVVELN